MDIASDIYKGFNRLFSNEIFVKTDDMESVAGDPYGEVFLVWLKLTGREYKVEPSLTGDVSKGLTSVSFEEACVELIKQKEKYDRDRAFNVLISAVVQEMVLTVHKLKVQPVSSDRKMLYHLHDLLQTLEDNIGTNRLYGKYPSIYDCLVYSAVKNLMDDKDTAKYFDYHSKLVMFLYTIEVMLKNADEKRCVK